MYEHSVWGAGEQQVAFVCLTMIVGTAFLSFAIANMFDLISSIKRKNNLYDSNVDQLKYWLEHKKIPKNTQVGILHPFCICCCISMHVSEFKV